MLEGLFFMRGRSSYNYSLQGIKLTSDEKEFSKRAKRLLKKISSKDTHVILPRCRLIQTITVIVPIFLLMGATIVYLFLAKPSIDQLVSTSPVQYSTNKNVSLDEKPVSGLQKQFDLLKTRYRDSQHRRQLFAVQIKDLEQKLKNMELHIKKELNARINELENENHALKQDFELVNTDEKSKFDRHIEALRAENRQIRNELKNLQRIQNKNRESHQKLSSLAKPHSVLPKDAVETLDVPKSENDTAIPLFANVDITALSLHSLGNSGDFRYETTVQSKSSDHTVESQKNNEGLKIKLKVDGRPLKGHLRLVLIGLQSNQNKRIYVPKGSLTRAKGQEVQLVTTHTNYRGSFRIPKNFTPTEARVEVVLYGSQKKVLRKSFVWSTLTSTISTESALLTSDLSR